jgi:PAS domain S-box-containing protein
VPAVFASSQFLLAVLMGVSSYIGLLHLGFWRSSHGRGRSSHGWVALFCAVSLVYMAGRYLEVCGEDLATAVMGGRFQVAAGAFLVYTLLGFARSLRRLPFEHRFHAGLLLVTSLLAWAALFSELMVRETGFVDTDWFGRQHSSPDVAEGLLLLGLYATSACLYVVVEVRRSPHISLLEKRVVIGSVTVYAAMGLWTVASAIGATSLPTLSQFGLVVIASGLSYLLVHQHRRMQTELEVLVEERARQLQETDARYRLLVENAPLGIFAIDRDGRALTVNRHLLRLLGAPVDGVDEAVLARLDMLGAEPMLRSGLAQPLRTCLDTGRAFVGDFVFEAEGAARREWRINAAPIRDAHRSIVGAQVIAEEIGERKRLEERVRQSQKMEAVGGLAAGIAHELNNPLSYVRANIAMLRKEWDERVGRMFSGSGEGGESLLRCRDMIDDALEGVDRAVAIVREVNEFSHGQDSPLDDVDLNDLLEDSLRVASPQLRPGIEVECRYGSLPPVSCSPGQMRQVFLNLIVNAIHAFGRETGSEGQLRLETQHLPEKGEVLVRVCDDGPGIAEEHLDRLFEPFFTTKPSGQGTGLGLYICYEIVRMHAGTISVETGPRTGTCVTVHLPVKL